MGLAAWIEATIQLPEGLSAEPGPVRLWPWQREIADMICDPTIERVTLVKPVRVGFTALLTSAIAYHVVERPAPILCLLPTQADCRDFLVSDVESLFDASPALRGRLPTPTTAGRSARNTLLHRLYPGGSLKVVAGKAPRNLRRHTCKILLIDEVDAIEVSAEGDPVVLAERRTLSFADRKIIIGSTPLAADTSHVVRSYAESDQRVFEVPCPACGAFSELRWQNLEWPPNEPERAAWRCPHCCDLVQATAKPAMVQAGRWRATRPEVKGHAGFRLNSLVSLMANASWAKLVREYEQARGDDDRMKVFVNTVLGEAWREQVDEIDDEELAKRVEPFSIDNTPPEVAFITVGADVQADRIEALIMGHAQDGTAYCLAHDVMYGDAHDDELWSEVDQLLRRRWPHPGGGELRVDAAVIDSGGRIGIYDRVVKFCNARLGRRVLPGKGVAGFARPIVQMTRTKKASARLAIIGVDVVKAQLLARLSRGRSIRFSNTLTPQFFEQLTSERRVVRMTRGRPMARFERRPGMAAEGLDITVYALAARALIALSAAAFAQRSDELHMPAPPKPPPAVIRSAWMDR